MAYESERGRVASGLERNSRRTAGKQRSGLADWKLPVHVYAGPVAAGPDRGGQGGVERVEETEKAVASCDPYLERIRRNPADVEAGYELGRIFAGYISRRQAGLAQRRACSMTRSARGLERLLIAANAEAETSKGRLPIRGPLRHYPDR